MLSLPFAASESPEFVLVPALVICDEAGGAAGGMNSPSSLASLVWILPRTSANSRRGYRRRS